jgi:orotidine 5'-phosphate decarboxylase subfamily 1
MEGKKRYFTYKERAAAVKNPVAKKLYAIMEQKQTNLALAADVTTKKELLELAEKVGPSICMLKTHIDIIKDFDWDLITRLQACAHKQNFLLCEDRKFADIGNTVAEQYAGGIYRIAEWADIVIAHAIFGQAIIPSLQNCVKNKERGLLLVAQASAADNLITPGYTKQVVEMAKQSDFVIGLIAQEQCTDDPRFIHCTPGVKWEDGGDSQGQQYHTPQSAFARGSDLIIVGRGIYQAKDPETAAKEYCLAGWNAHLQNK